MQSGLVNILVASLPGFFFNNNEEIVKCTGYAECFIAIVNIGTKLLELYDSHSPDIQQVIKAITDTTFYSLINHKRG